MLWFKTTKRATNLEGRWCVIDEWVGDCFTFPSRLAGCSGRSSSTAGNSNSRGPAAAGGCGPAATTTNDVCGRCVLFCGPNSDCLICSHSRHLHHSSSSTTSFSCLPHCRSAATFPNPPTASPALCCLRRRSSVTWWVRTPDRSSFICWLK